ncbi:MAG TPA: hypothetical protein VI006_12080 [Solirubrobacteraceae bacterium]
MVVEPVAERGFVDHVGELVRGQRAGQVDQRARGCGDRDALVGRGVFFVEVAASMDRESFTVASVARHEHVDAVPAAAPDLPVDGGREVAQHRSVAGRQDGGQPAPFRSEPPMAHGVNTAIKGVEAAGPHALRSPVSVEAGRRELRARDHAVLPARHRRDPSVNAGCVTFVASWATFVNHPPSVAATAFQFTP